jgi:hypothetical protein
MATKIIEGKGFAVHGQEEDYLVFISAEKPVFIEASSLLPKEGAISWSHFHALTEVLNKSIGRESCFVSQELGFKPTDLRYQ